MSSIAHKYADFSASSGNPDSIAEKSKDALEDQKLQSFEEGYQAGWADAANALKNDQQSLTAEFAQNIQDMSFTYHEALAKMTAALRPLVNQMVTSLLPTAAQASLVGHISQELNALIEQQIGGEAKITVSPEGLGAAKALLAQSDTDVPFKLCTDNTLSGGQVYLRVGKAEREVDLDTVTHGIVEAIDAFFNQTNSEPSND